MLKQFIHIGLFIILFLFLGCKPKIQLSNIDSLSIPYLYGKTNERIFIYNDKMSDSLKFLWKVELTGSFRNTGLSLKEHYAFVNDLSGRVVCLDLNKGNIIGQVKTSGSVVNTPILYNNYLIFIENTIDNEKSFLSTYDIFQGEYSLHKEIDGKILTEILVENGFIYFVSSNGVVCKYNLLGDIIWQFNSKLPVHSSPALSNGVLVYGTDDGCIIALNKDDGKQLYKIKLANKAFESGFTIKDSIIYACNNNGFLYGIDLMSGKLLLKSNIGSRVVTFPIISDYIYVVTLKGDIICLNLKGEPAWKLNTEGIFNVTPILSGDFLIIPDLNKKLLLVNTKERKITKTIFLDGKSGLTPVIYQNKLLIGYGKGIVEAYEIIH